MTIIGREMGSEREDHQAPLLTWTEQGGHGPPRPLI
jgi:hypothetical protein